MAKMLGFCHAAAPEGTLPCTIPEAKSGTGLVLPRNMPCKLKALPMFQPPRPVPVKAAVTANMSPKFFPWPVSQVVKSASNATASSNLENSEKQVSFFAKGVAREPLCTHIFAKLVTLATFQLPRPVPTKADAPSNVCNMVVTALVSQFEISLLKAALFLNNSVMKRGTRCG